MDIVDVFALVVSVYAAVVSSILGVRELKRDRRRISVMLELVPFYETAQVTIVNIGHRQVTLTDMAIGDCPRNCLLAEVVEEPFPVTLDDGEHITLPLSEVLSEMVASNPRGVRLHVYDAEGHEYTKFSVWEHNPKWGTYRKIASDANA
jgi:hypothetical protein